MKLVEYFKNENTVWVTNEHDEIVFIAQRLEGDLWNGDFSDREIEALLTERFHKERLSLTHKEFPIPLTREMVEQYMKEEWE